MINEESYWDTVLQILTGRSLNPIPWSPEEEAQLSKQERVLWMALSPAERRQAALRLRTLWKGPRYARDVQTDVSWGSWAGGVIRIQDYAFGVPVCSFRPPIRDVQQLQEEYPGCSATLGWLWAHGFRPLDVQEAGILVETTPARGVKEARRLLECLVRQGPPGTTSVDVSLRYDPASDQAWLLVAYTKPSEEVLRPVDGIDEALLSH